MKILSSQEGIGLVEVLVALFLLAIGVLGYTALQLRAVDAGNEALTKSQATLILRGLTEGIRTNVAGQSEYPAAVQSYVAIELSNADKSKTVPEAPKSCLNPTAACTSKEMAKYDAYLAAKDALDLGMRITMTECPGVTNTNSIKRQCLFAAWENTQLTATDYSNCMTVNGVYKVAAKCLMMEAY